MKKAIRRFRKVFITCLKAQQEKRTGRQARGNRAQSHNDDDENDNHKERAPDRDPPPDRPLITRGRIQDLYSVGHDAQYTVSGVHPYLHPYHYPRRCMLLVGRSNGSSLANLSIYS